MIFGIFIFLLLAAIAFFHYVQGFFSATISAIVAVISAVVAVSYYETVVEGPLAGVAPEWMPMLVLLALFALPYVILRTLFDKLVPGQVSLPAVVDKIGGAVMGVVAGVFGLGVVVIGAQHMAFGPSIGGYVRYETSGTRGASVPAAINSFGQSVGRGKDAATYDEVVGVGFDPEKAKGLYIDDAVVNAVEHLSDQGSLSRGKPFRSVHPDLLQELFGQRLGMQSGGSRVSVNSAKRTDVTVTGVFMMPPVPAAKIVDGEFKTIRGGNPVKLTPAPPAGELRLVVRVKFDQAAADAKDRKIRISPGAVRLVGKHPSDDADGLEPHNYFPIGTLEPNGFLYANKIDDYLFVDALSKKLDGSGEAPSEVDFVFQVKDQGVVSAGTEPNSVRIEPGTFLEVKKFGRVDLSAGDLANVKRAYAPLTVLAVKRKTLNAEQGPAPLQPDKSGAGSPAGAPAAAAGATPGAPAAPGGGGGTLGQRLVGEWKTGTVVTGGETITFAADGGMTSVGPAGTVALRWVASGPSQGETLAIRTAAAGADPATGEQRTIVFEDENQFSMTDSVGNRRFARVGSPAAAASPTGPDAAMSSMIGTWASEAGLSYTFRPDGTYTAAQTAVAGNQARTGGGTWRVKGVRENGRLVDIELLNKAGKATPQAWNVGAASSGQLRRVAADGAETTFTRSS